MAELDPQAAAEYRISRRILSAEYQPKKIRLAESAAEFLPP